MKDEKAGEADSPALKAAYLEVVNNQLRDDDPPETKETLDRLVAGGLSEEDAKILIAQALCVETFSMLKRHEEFNRERFVRNLKQLPEELFI